MASLLGSRFENPMQLAVRILIESWSVLGQMAPYLLFGFLAAGILSVCISPEFVERHLGGRGFRSVLKAALFGVPLPLCSCGVIPVGASLRRHGASRAATTSFLLSTPQTGIDSILITYALLGLLFAIYRPFIALATGLLGGLLVMIFAEPRDGNGSAAEPTPECRESCCSGGSSRNFVRRAIEYGFITLPRDVGLSLLVGVLIAGAITALVPQPNELQPYLGQGIVSILLMMALGVPLYVCASASVPIAAGLIHLGASPGAALAFLISGPATNAATIATIWKLLGRRTALLYLLTIALVAVGAGLLLDWLMPVAHAVVPPLAHAHPMEASPWLEAFWSVVLLLVFGLSYASRPSANSHAAETHDEAHESITLNVTGMTCEHCEAAVRRALGECHGVTAVHVDRPSGRATVSGDEIQPDQLIAAVRAAGYTAAVSNA